ncbi:metallophosphoesterase [Paenibacillaceae bacterium]|nr:metallophosphoesterase [Paenibacillaceae bacterium]
MLIGVVSDTHMPRRGKKLPPRLVEAFGKVDLIVHAGDWTLPEVIPLFQALAPLEGVAGNNDGPAIVKRFGRSKIIEAQSKRIGIVHGDGSGRTAADTAFRTFSKQAVDVIIFGHSHIPLLEERSGILLFNPGSPTDKRKQAQYSFGLLRIDKTMTARHVFYSSKV